MIPHILLALLIAIGFVTDVRWRKIPNILNVSAVLAGGGYYMAVDGWKGLLFSVGGMVTLFVIMLILYVLKAVGAGDVKLFAAIGALVGWMVSIQILVYSVLYAGLIAMLVLTVQRAWPELRARGKKLGIGLIWLRNKDSWLEAAAESRRFPFMYAVLPEWLPYFICPGS